MENLAIKKSTGRREKRNTSYINLEIGIKRNLVLVAGDTLNLFINDDFDLGRISPSVSGNIVLLINQTIKVNSDDKIIIKFELSSSTAEIGIIRKGE